MRNDAFARFVAWLFLSRRVSVPNYGEWEQLVEWFCADAIDDLDEATGIERLRVAIAVFASGLRFRLLFGPGQAFSRLPEDACFMPPAKLTFFAILVWLGMRFNGDKKGPSKGRRIELIGAGVP